jgi:hypothetical protein
MAWRLSGQLIEGELDNRTLGQVTGWLRFAGVDGTVRLELSGDFHRDIRGAKIRLTNPDPPDGASCRGWMEGFATVQAGNAGDITAGHPPHDYGERPYIEWYSERNGRVVLTPDPGWLEVVGRPIPWQESEPVSRREQERLLHDFVSGLLEGPDQGGDDDAG